MKDRKKYTEHRVTTGQLVRLSQIVNGHPNFFGPALKTLERKGLVVEKPNMHALRRAYGLVVGDDCFYLPTPAGTLALGVARAEGW